MKPSELLSDESKWTKGVYARNKYGNYVHSTSTEATCWCLAGALDRCYKDDQVEYRAACFGLDNMVLSEHKLKSFIAFNDDPKTTFADVKSLLEKAGL